MASTLSKKGPTLTNQEVQEGPDPNFAGDAISGRTALYYPVGKTFNEALLDP